MMGMAVAGRQVLPVVLLGASMACASSAGPSAATVAASVEASAPGCRVARESRISLGWLKLAAIRTLMGLAEEDDDEAMEMLRNISRVEVATYRIATPALCAGSAAFGEVDRHLTTDGWWPMVRERGGPESAMVFAHGDCSSDLDGLYVVSFDGDELEVVRLEGRIERLMAEAISEEPGSASRLVEPAR
jgi:hypothetical protein